MEGLEQDSIFGLVFSKIFVRDVLSTDGHFGVFHHPIHSVVLGLVGKALQNSQEKCGCDTLNPVGMDQHPHPRPIF
jgi:hypothetical protein